MNNVNIFDEIRNSYESMDFSRLYGKKILITGATGLIGTYLTETVFWLNTQRNADITMYIVSHKGVPQHLKTVEEDANTIVLTGDLTDGAWRKTLPTVDFIIHAAGYGQPGKFTAAPERTISINTSATMDLLERLDPSGSFLFISTSEVYSGLEKDRYTEEDIGTTTPLHPRACYIEGKRCGEAICMAFREKGIDAKCARLALAYGPGTQKDDHRVLNQLISKAFYEHKVYLMDSGSAIRTYCYVTDAVEHMWNILLHGVEPVYNVGGHSTITIRDLAEKIASIMDVDFEVPQESGALVGAPKSVVLDLSKVENCFHKKAYVSIDEGLQRTILWQKHHVFG